MAINPRAPQQLLPEAFVRGYQMAHDETLHIDVAGQPVDSPEVTEEKFGCAVPTIAKVQAADQLFSVLDTRTMESSRFPPLLVVSNKFDYKTTDRHYMGIYQHAGGLMIGRQSHNDNGRFDYSPKTSRYHFTLAFDGLGLIVRNLKPTHRTLLTGDIQSRSQHDFERDNIRAIFTHNVEHDRRNGHDFGVAHPEAPYGYHKNHPIIGRDSPSVKNGVYFTTRPDSEAVIVDDKSDALQQAQKQIIRLVESKIDPRHPTMGTESILKLVNSYTQKLMPYSARISDKLSAPFYKGNNLIGLSDYVEARGGVCRHQCLLAAFMVEALVEKGLLDGRTGVERNHDIDAHGAHAWAIFKSSTGETFVIDPAQKFAGTKQQARAEGRWKYDIN